MLDFTLHIVSQFDWDSIKDGVYVTAPLIVVLTGILIGMVHPVAGATASIITDHIMRRVSPATIGAIGEVLTGKPALGHVGSGISIYDAVGEMVRRSIEVGLRKQKELYPDIVFMPLPPTWDYPPPLGGGGGGGNIPSNIPDEENPLPGPKENPEEPQEKSSPLPFPFPKIPKIDLKDPRWRGMPLEEIAKVLGLTADELILLLILRDIF